MGYQLLLEASRDLSLLGIMQSTKKTSIHPMIAVLFQKSLCIFGVMSLLLLPLSILQQSSVSAFTTTTNPSKVPSRTGHTNSAVWLSPYQTQKSQSAQNFRSTPLMAWRLIGKYFQMEEMEDREACTTEVILNPNSTVTTLETNGPIHIAANGMWKLDKLTGDFIMTLHRTYEAGRDSKISTDVGVFTFTTVRKFIGRLYNIGIKQGISGNIYDVTSGALEDNSSLADLDDTTPVTELRKVGFFEMIDTTLSEDGGVTLPGRAQSM